METNKLLKLSLYQAGECALMLAIALFYFCNPMLNTVFKKEILLFGIALNIISGIFGILQVVSTARVFGIYQDYERVILVAILLAEAVFAFGCFASVVQGNSMHPTLEEGDRLLIVRTRNFKKGDIVVISYDASIQNESPIADGELIVKRVIALPGERVEGRGLVLEPDTYWVCGDNRDVSLDSRSFGPVQKKQIYGIAKYKINKFFKWEKLPKWEELP